MSRQAPALILTVVLALFAGVGGAWIGARFVFPRRHSPSLHELVHKELDLSKEQKAQIAMLEQQFAARRRAREDKLHVANAELAAAINERHEYSHEVQTALEHFHKAMGELRKKTVEHVLATRKVLRPDQAINFDRHVSEALTTQTP